jgi:hypothetical protein
LFTFHPAHRSVALLRRIPAFHHSGFFSTTLYPFRHTLPILLVKDHSLSPFPDISTAFLQPGDRVLMKRFTWIFYSFCTFRFHLNRFRTRVLYLHYIPSRSLELLFSSGLPGLIPPVFLLPPR